MEFLKRFAKPIGIGFAVLLLIIGISLAYGKAGQYWQALKDQILQEQRQVQTELESQLKIVSAQKANAEAQMAKLKLERDHLKKKYVVLQGEKDALAKKLASVVVPADPDGIVLGFQQLGLKSAHARPAR